MKIRVKILLADESGILLIVDTYLYMSKGEAGTAA